MQARDATGRQVSLLNDESYFQPQNYRTASYYQPARDASPLPHTPELLRSDSYDSNMSYDPASPMTPTVYDYSTHVSFDEFSQNKPAVLQRPAYIDNSRANSYEDDSSNGSSVPERAGKRYPCRYRDSHGCEKTFTTSGHASRHSKIHTAEKAVQCTFQGCHKKFTRADNMKQHLETHFKDKSRTISSKASSKTASSKRGSVSLRSTISHYSQSSQDVPMWDAEPYGMPDSIHDGVWNMGGLQVPLVSRPIAVRTSSGLDALAAIACQAGGDH